MPESSERFPLFPLGMVLLPEEVVPLHIFEERYRTMIEERLEEETEFGIVWAGEDGLSDVGCAAEVAQLIERMEDGRMNVLVQGTRPFRLTRRIEDMPYPAGDVEWLEQEAGQDEEVAAGARDAYADLVEQVTDSRPSESDLGQLDAYGMAATIAFDLSDKQELLELRAEDDRMARLTDLCAAAMKRLARSQEASERAGSNGKVHH
ncbi:MAG: LON peptidase substrate-binding domain-containing protein [Thermoleophilaceae bacterium]